MPMPPRPVRSARVSLPWVVTVLVLVGCGCAPGVNPMVGHGMNGHLAAGFWLGLWHGVILWPTFFLSLFSPHVSVYEVFNTGWPYNLGFVLGAASLHGGGAAAARRSRVTARTVVVQG